MSKAVSSSRLVFRRTWPYRWIGAPLGVLGAVLLLLGLDASRSGWAAATGIVACLSIALSLWLPARLAAWPLRVLAVMMSVGFAALFLSELKSKPASYYDNWAWMPALLHSGGGFVLFSIPGMWFALTGRVGWRKDEKLVLI